MDTSSDEKITEVVIVRRVSRPVLSKRGNMGASKKEKQQKHSVVHLMESYNTILMTPRAARAAADVEECSSPEINNLQWFLVGNNETFTSLDEHLIYDHEMIPVRDRVRLLTKFQNKNKYFL